MSRPLEIAACRRLCSWHDTETLLDGEHLFACSGCGSEWVASQSWTPVDHTGVVPEPVQVERRRRGRG
ncbi:MAG TPA: hypothetical protein VFZ64_01850 [Nocardioidaceae bacterium]